VVCVCVCVCVCVNAYLCVCVYVGLCMCVFGINCFNSVNEHNLPTDTHTYTYTRTHTAHSPPSNGPTCTHTHTHTQATHTHTQTPPTHELLSHHPPMDQWQLNCDGKEQKISAWNKTTHTHTHTDRKKSVCPKPADPCQCHTLPTPARDGEWVSSLASAFVLY